MLPTLVIDATALPVPSRREVAARLAASIRSFSHHVIAARRAGKLDEMAIAGAIRRTFEDLGGTFTKFGQLIASSPSIFGDDVAHEFRGCLDSGPPVSFYEVRAVIEADLGRPLHEIFATFEPEPLAAASL